MSDYSGGPARSERELLLESDLGNAEAELARVIKLVAAAQPQLTAANRVAEAWRALPKRSREAFRVLDPDLAEALDALVEETGGGESDG